MHFFWWFSALSIGVINALQVSWIPKASRASVYRSWRGGTYTYPKWPRMQNICKTHMKHKFLRWWNVCDAYVKRMCSASENICEPYVKYMWNICEIHVTYQRILGLDCVVFMFYLCIRLWIYVFFYVGGKIRPYFVQITQNKALFWNARKENINKTQTRTQTHFVTFVYDCVCTCVYGLCFIYGGRKIRPYFGQIRPYFIAYVKETQTKHKENN